MKTKNRSGWLIIGLLVETLLILSDQIKRSSSPGVNTYNENFDGSLQTIVTGSGTRMVFDYMTRIIHE